MRFVLIGFLASLLSLKLIEIDLVEPKDLIAGDKAEFACWSTDNHWFVYGRWDGLHWRSILDWSKIDQKGIGCSQAAKKLEIAYNGGFAFLTLQRIGGKPVICAARSDGGLCTHEVVGTRKSILYEYLPLIRTCKYQPAPCMSCYTPGRPYLDVAKLLATKNVFPCVIIGGGLWYEDGSSRGR